MFPRSLKHVVLLTIAMMLAACDTTPTPTPVSPQPTSAADLTPIAVADTFSVNGEQAQAVNTVMRIINAYNAGRLEDLLPLLDPEIVWTDCDHRTARGVQSTGKDGVAAWLRERFADHDRFEVAQVWNANPDALTVVGVDFARRTGDTLRELGFTRGIKQSFSTTVVFTEGNERIAHFSNGPIGGSQELCKPVAAEQ
jgi:hypothetical protein